jgi:hypothetical protein
LKKYNGNRYSLGQIGQQENLFCKKSIRIGYRYIKLNSDWIHDPYRESMSGPDDPQSETGSLVVRVQDRTKMSWRIFDRVWISETFNKSILIKLVLVSLFLTLVDTVQSYYLQRVVNQFNEVNLLPMRFYNFGAVGYVLYFPIDFFALFGTLTVLWIWASYILWYHRHVIAPKLKIGVPRLT